MKNIYYFYQNWSTCTLMCKRLKTNILNVVKRNNKERIVSSFFPGNILLKNETLKSSF